VNVTEFAGPLPMNRTFCPPEQAGQLSARAAPLNVFHHASASPRYAKPGGRTCTTTSWLVESLARRVPRQM
jgi:hypothetical protein